MSSHNSSKEPAFAGAMLSFRTVLRSAFLVLLATSVALQSSAQAGPQPTSRRLLTEPEPIAIQWLDSLRGDFYFSKKWEYPFGVERLPNGMPGCADGGFCPPEAQAMQDAHGGRIPKDSLAAFYALLDTTHRHYTLQGQARTYEYAGTHYLTARRTDTSTVVCASETDVATHGTLILLLSGDTCLAFIALNSIVSPLGGEANINYFASGGNISIDRPAWQRDTLKATFSFSFQDPEHPKQPMTWSGNILTPIDRNQP